MGRCHYPFKDAGIGVLYARWDDAEKAYRDSLCRAKEPYFEECERILDALLGTPGVPTDHGSLRREDILARMKGGLDDRLGVLGDFVLADCLKAKGMAAKGGE